LLNEAGWLDDLYDSAKGKPVSGIFVTSHLVFQQLERSRNTSIRIEQLLIELGPSSSKAIPGDVRAKVLKMIQEAIERIVEG
jgi:hypothetical protein